MSSMASLLDGVVAVELLLLLSLMVLLTRRARALAAAILLDWLEMDLDMHILLGEVLWGCLLCVLLLCVFVLKIMRRAKALLGLITMVQPAAVIIQLSFFD